MAQAKGVRDLIAVGESRIDIQQVQYLINSNQPNLQRRLASCEAQKVIFDSVRLVHVKRDCNQAPYYFTSKTLLLGRSQIVQEDEEHRHLGQEDRGVSEVGRNHQDHLILWGTDERWRPIKVHQKQDEYLCELRDFLNDKVERFAPRKLRKVAKVADLSSLDARGVLYRLA
ncbi:hypothetical protein PHMEG_0006742 [Phytophthora megakarya]|uniref:RNase H type-1 domain-containing protein n=1 Tax=Phytophthora megakarya TaxID=4795 RepID=A0A225WPZ3_9STRA|nr:hypothetical protein PHMEG_0006742 [Phytophthora megakarya]